MMWFPNHSRSMVAGVVGVISAVAVGIAVEPMVDLRIPLEFYPSGELKAELFAARAHMPPDGRIRAYGLVVKGYSEKGDPEIVLKAEDCVLDRVGQVATSTNHVSLKRGDVNVSGDGFSWNGTDERLKILKHARVVFPTAIVKEKRVRKRVQSK
jgi:hypothetical protein